MKFTQDIHVHTKLSACAKPEAVAKDYLIQAKELGFDTIAFADHMWDKAVGEMGGFYQYQDVPHVLRLREQMTELDEAGIRYLIGCECEYDYAHHDIAISREGAEQLDHLLVPISHTHIVCPRDIRDDVAKHADFMFRAFMDVVESKNAKYVTAIAHPFAAVGCPYPKEDVMKLYTESMFRECFTAAAQADIAMEFNPFMFSAAKSNEKEDLLDNCFVQMLIIAKQCGCRFTYGSDKHSAVDYKRHERTEAAADAMGLTEEDIKLI